MAALIPDVEEFSDRGGVESLLNILKVEEDTKVIEAGLKTLQ